MYKILNRKPVEGKTCALLSLNGMIPQQLGVYLIQARSDIET
jgi:hypothetical protein